MYQVYAATCGTFQFGCTTVSALINAIIDSINVLAIGLAVVFLVVGGIKYITASGNKEKATEAKSMLTQVLIGIAVIMGMNIIFELMKSILGTPSATITAPARPQFDLQS